VPRAERRRGGIAAALAAARGWRNANTGANFGLPLDVYVLETRRRRRRCRRTRERARGVGRGADWTLTESETERDVDGGEEEGTGKGETMGERESGGPRGRMEKEIEDARGVVYVYMADT